MSRASDAKSASPSFRKSMPRPDQPLRLYARMSNAKGASLYGMPGGTVRVESVPYGACLPLSGARMWCARENSWYFPVQYGDAILWASEAGFTIIRGRPR